MKRNLKTVRPKAPLITGDTDYLDAIETLNKALEQIEANKSDKRSIDERSAERQQGLRDKAALNGYPYSDNYIPNYFVA